MEPMSRAPSITPLAPLRGRQPLHRVIGRAMDTRLHHRMETPSPADVISWPRVITQLTISTILLLDQQVLTGNHQDSVSPCPASQRHSPTPVSMGPPTPTKDPATTRRNNLRALQAAGRRSGLESRKLVASSAARRFPPLAHQLPVWQQDLSTETPMPALIALALQPIQRESVAVGD